ncbi:MAG: heterodisulfide reductase-related iron-sulfur binding cluster [Planctomycetota bacterium]
MTQTTPLQPTAQGLIDYARSLDCIHCGLCLHTCPTYRLTGREASSPRGRVYLMRAVAEGRLDPGADFAEEMEFCLVCRHCESACPAGVEFGAMMEFTRAGLQTLQRRGPLVRLARWMGFRVVLVNRRWLALSVTLLGLAQRFGLVRLLAPLAGARGRALAALPRVPARSKRRPLAAHTPGGSPARGQGVGRVAMLEGCVMPELFGRVNRATLRCLTAVGDDVHVPADHVCCGALHAHNGDRDGARELALRTLDAFEPLAGPVVVNSAGCAAHMKEYGRSLADVQGQRKRAQDFANRVVDLAEYLHSGGRLERLSEQLGPSPLGRFAWDAPCHQCHGQQIREAPLALLDAIPGSERVELRGAESCCGSAGIYSLLRPADANAVLRPKLEELAQSGAQTLITANPGCQLQWESGVLASGLKVRVMHLAEALAGSLDGFKDDPGDFR